MKKLYLSLLLTTITPLVCMEQERPRKRTTSSEAQFPSVNPSTILPIHLLSMQPGMLYATRMHTNSTIRPQTQNIPICEANQPGWQQLNRIMNTSYQSDQSDCAHEVELKPIYRPMSTNTTQQEKKPLLRTLGPMKYNERLIDDIYDKARSISFDFTLKDLTNIITMMNSAKVEHINEDVMGKHAHTLLLPYKNSQMKYHEKTAPVLFFGYLKHYNQTVNTTKEQLPKGRDIFRKISTTKVNNRLAQELNLSSSVNVPHESIRYDEAYAIENYPAFAALKKAVGNNYDKTCNNFLSYIYSENNTPQNNYLHLSYDELKSEMYERAINCERWCADNDNFIYNMMRIIEAGKALMPQKNEHDFGYDMIESEQTLIGKALSFANIDRTSSIRKRIGMLCHLIQTYNTHRATKKSPTMEQYLAYKNYCQLCPFYLTNLSTFAFPDTFDRTLLDENAYAFDELKKLIDTLWTLRSASDENVQECIDQIYPPRKK